MGKDRKELTEEQKTEISSLYLSQKPLSAHGIAGVTGISEQRVRSFIHEQNLTRPPANALIVPNEVMTIMQDLKNEGWNCPEISQMISETFDVKLRRDQILYILNKHEKK